MPFIHPAIFWMGLAAASIPIIIHLLNRRRFRVREWAAMKFLLESVRKNRRRVRIEEIILLALRTLALIMLALAVGRFTGCDQTNALMADKGSATIVFVLDDSGSMGQKSGSGSLLAAATADLIEQLRKVPQGDRLAIMLTSQNDPAEAFLKPTFADKNIIEAAVAKLQALRPSDTRVDLAASLAAAESVFKSSPTRTSQLWLVSDFRKVDLQREQAQAMRKKFADLKAAGVKVVAVDYGRPGRGNLTVESVELMDKFAVANQPIHIRLSVRNNGLAPAANVEVQVFAKYLVDQKFQKLAIPVQTIPSIEPQEVRSLECQVTLAQAGSAVLTAELPSDDLGVDNSASLAVDIRPSIRALIVDGSYDAANPMANESYFFVHAIDPNGNGSYGCRPDVVSVEGLTNVALDDYDLVVLMNLGSFAVDAEAATVDAEGKALPAEDIFRRRYPQLAALEQYVAAGGGLAIFPGDKINYDFYGPTRVKTNEGRFYNDGLGLLPLPLLPVSGDPSNSTKFVRFDPKSLAGDSLLKTFADIRREGQDPTRLIRIFGFCPMAEMNSPAASQDIKPVRVLARLTDAKNSPAIVARSYFKGTVVLFCTTAGLRWNDWPIDEVGTYAATMNDLLVYLAHSARTELTGAVGQPLVYELPHGLREARCTLKTPLYPDAEEVALAPQAQDKRNLVRYERPINAGTYWLAMVLPDKSRKDVLIARNVEPAEGQLAPGHQAEITAALGAGDKDYVYIDRTGSASAQQAAGPAGKEYWMWAIGALLVLLAAETFLGQKFGHYV